MDLGIVGIAYEFRYINYGLIDGEILMNSLELKEILNLFEIFTRLCRYFLNTKTAFGCIVNVFSCNLLQT